MSQKSEPAVLSSKKARDISSINYYLNDINLNITRINNNNSQENNKIYANICNNYSMLINFTQKLLKTYKNDNTYILKIDNDNITLHENEKNYIDYLNKKLINYITNFNFIKINNIDLKITNVDILKYMNTLYESNNMMTINNRLNRIFLINYLQQLYFIIKLLNIFFFNNKENYKNICDDLEKNYQIK